MKKLKIAYYIVTVIFSLFIIAGSIPDILAVPGAREFITNLGYPVYVLYIVGWAKVFGIIGIWQPKSRSLQEWAYAGLTFDLVGALWSHLAAGDAAFLMVPALIALTLLSASYLLRRKYERAAIMILSK